MARLYKYFLVDQFVDCAGIFIARGKEDALVTYNLVIGESVYGEKRISVEVFMPPAS